MKAGPGRRAAGRAWAAIAAAALLAGAFAGTGCGVAVRGACRQVMAVRNSQWFYQGRHGPLTSEEQAWAQIAWKYFQRNTSPRTGLVNGAEGEARATLSDAADYLAALVAARRMNLVAEKEFQDRLTSVIGTLNSMRLAGDALPNRYYSTETARPVNAQGQEAQVGWSAMDLGRLLLWLRIVRQQRPEFAEYIDRVVMRWDACSLVDVSGNLLQGTYQKDQWSVAQEGRLGYEEYAAQGLRAWGFDTARASALEPFEPVKLYDIELLYDRRDERESGVLSPIVSTPYLLAGMELNWQDADGARPGAGGETVSYAELASRVYRVQELRYQRERIFTARTDHRAAHVPSRVVDAIFVKGYPWNTVAESGDALPGAALVATQAVFPMRALWKTAYTDRLTRVVSKLYEQEKGWYEGRYENTGSAERIFTLRTNALVLESLLYQLEGRLYHPDERVGPYDLWRTNPFRANAVCRTAASAR